MTRFGSLLFPRFSARRAVAHGGSGLTPFLTVAQRHPAKVQRQPEPERDGEQKNGQETIPRPQQAMGQSPPRPNQADGNRFKAIEVSLTRIVVAEPEKIAEPAVGKSLAKGSPLAETSGY